MFTFDIKNKRVVIEHTVRALDGRVDLTTIIDFCDVSEEKVLLWAATNRLTRWLDSVEIGRLTGVEVKKRFDNLIIECKGYFQSNVVPISHEDMIMIDNFRKVLGDGVSMEKVLQSLVRSTVKLAH